jgi:hypothetical protein
MDRQTDPKAIPGKFFESLSEAGKDLSPVNYRFIVSRPANAGEPLRLAQSRYYRADLFACFTYHKPISKVLPPDEK